MPTIERFKVLPNHGLAYRLVDVMTGAQFSHTRLYTWLLAKYLASYTTYLQHIEYQHITQCRILKKYLTLAHTPASVKVGDGQRASEFSVRPSEIPLARYCFYALPQQILRFTLQVGQLCRIGVGRV